MRYSKHPLIFSSNEICLEIIGSKKQIKELVEHIEKKYKATAPRPWFKVTSNDY